MADAREGRPGLDDDGKLHQLYVYGELFGGMYPGLPTPPTQAHVQKGIYYSPTYDFFAFDLHDGHSYLDYDLAERIFQTAGFFYGEALLKYRPHYTLLLLFMIFLYYLLLLLFVIITSFY